MTVRGFSTRAVSAALAVALSALAFTSVQAQDEAASTVTAASAEAAVAAETEGIPEYPLVKPERQSWSFAGPFGTYDAAQLQRGLEVYTQVCSFCHGLKRVAFRTLASENGPFLTEEQMRALAASFTVVDPETGESREGRPADYFPTPNYPGTATPPDLSLMAKARGVGGGFQFLLDPFIQYQQGGPDYIYALLTGYEPAPEGVDVPPGTFYNPHFNAAVTIAMPPPLSDGRVAYSDGTPETVDQYARDVSAFLMWTAEPKLVDRKWLGFEVMVFLIVFAGITYFAKRRVWAKEH
jgi:ubiquinol-cytochrome c reductase cytochrome c1 subunit